MWPWRRRRPRNVVDAKPVHFKTSDGLVHIEFGMQDHHWRFVCEVESVAPRWRRMALPPTFYKDGIEPTEAEATCLACVAHD